MRMAIVGHGPSLLHQPSGAEIDAHDFIVRLKRSWDLPFHYSQFYGSKTHAVCGSRKTGRDMVSGWSSRGVDTIWLFDCSRTYGDKAPIPEGAYCDPELCKKWRGVYLSLRRPMDLNDAQTTYSDLSDDLGHKHQSAGSHAIMYAMDIVRPETITLFGFDSLTTGQFTWSVTRGEEWLQYPDHNWPAEMLLLDAMAAFYGYETRRYNDSKTSVEVRRRNAA